MSNAASFPDTGARKNPSENGTGRRLSVEFYAIGWGAICKEDQPDTPNKTTKTIDPRWFRER